MAKREFLQLAHNFNPKKHGIGGWFLSEKLDGMRCYWDGGVSRGLLKSDIPWANMDKDDRYIEPPIATGLWSRYGNVIHAPEWWLEALPLYPLDGELYSKLLSRQKIMSTIKSRNPGDGWADIRYFVFDIPPYDTVLADGRINNTNYKKTFKKCVEWVRKSAPRYWPTVTSFQTTYATLGEITDNDGVCVRHTQVQLPFSTADAEEVVTEILQQVSNGGGEGLIVRSGAHVYTCERVHHVIKIKKLDDAEGTVIGYITGRETTLGSKLLGMMGALILEIDNGKRLELSGFTDGERTLERVEGHYQCSAEKWAIENPETECPNWMQAHYFPRGTRVTFKYRGLSDDGIPQEARYWRKYDS